MLGRTSGRQPSVRAGGRWLQTRSRPAARGLAAAGGSVPAAPVAGAGATGPAGGSDVGAGTCPGATAWSAAANLLVAEARAGSERPSEASNGAGVGGGGRREIGRASC